MKESMPTAREVPINRPGLSEREKWEHQVIKVITAALYGGWMEPIGGSKANLDDSAAVIMRRLIDSGHLTPPA